MALETRLLRAMEDMNPFHDHIENLIPYDPPSKNTKSLSRIANMTVGDVRQCFAQMRATKFLNTKTILWCGMNAGEFALYYLVNSSSISRKKRPRASVRHGADEGVHEGPHNA